MMKLFSRHGVLLLMMIFIAACSVGKKTHPDRPKTPPMNPVFQKAEQLFAENAFEEAIVQYHNYIQKFPNDAKIPMALFQQGKCYLALEDYQTARDIFETLIKTYPAHPGIGEFKIALLKADQGLGNHAAVIENAVAFAEEMPSAEMRARIYYIQAKTYLATYDFKRGVEFLGEAYPLMDQMTQAEIRERVKEAMIMLSTPQIEMLYNRFPDRFPAGYLLYTQALNYMDEMYIDEAMQLLEAVYTRFPDHEFAESAASIYAKLAKETDYEQQTIGCLLPLSGQYQKIGERALNGIEWAYADYCETHAASTIKLKIEDTGSLNDMAIYAVHALAEAKVAAIMGPVVTAEAAAKESQKLGIPMITMTQKSRIPEIGDQIFRNFLTPAMQVKKLVSFAFDKLGVRKVAVLYPDENYGRRFLDIFWDEVILHGGVIVGAEAYNPAQTDFEKAIKKLVGLHYRIPEDLKESVYKRYGLLLETGEDKEKEDPPIIDFEALFIPDGPSKVGLIAPQLIYHDVEDVYLLGTNLWHSERLIKMAGRDLGGGVIPDAFFAESQKAAVKRAVTQFTETYAKKPGFIEAIAYDTAMILFETISRPDVRTRAQISARLTALDGYPGLTGSTRFDDSGDVDKDLYFLRVKGDRFVEIESP